MAHGCYSRKADRDKHSLLNPVPIPRFFCHGCHHTCSRLPACISPRRWYDWAIQQQILLLLLTGFSLYAVSQLVRPCRVRIPGYLSPLVAMADRTQHLL